MELQGRLKACAKELEQWGEDISAQFHTRKKELDRQMEELRVRSDEMAGEELRICREEKLRLLQQEETYWKQRAKQYWLQFGDLNKKFFHGVANGRRRRKIMKGLQAPDGTWKDNMDDMAAIARNYFEDLFQEGASEWQTVVDCVEQRVSSTDNIKLLAPFTDEEIKRAMFSIKADKPPGPDGFNPGFYQKFWHVVGGEISTSCRKWIETGTIPTFVQDTTIILLPKGERPQTMKDWRPISLCNVLYRLVAKVLATRLSKLMPKLVSEEQYAFVHGRSIVDNILIAFETLHGMKMRYRAKNGEVAIKNDISKAYDRVS
ncbi:Transposon TX1 uncharacterized 149 kDa protein [Linum grandiflorum]